MYENAAGGKEKKDKGKKDILGEIWFTLSLISNLNSHSFLFFHSHFLTLTSSIFNWGERLIFGGRHWKHF